MNVLKTYNDWQLYSTYILPIRGFYLKKEWIHVEVFLVKQTINRVWVKYLSPDASFLIYSFPLTFFHPQETFPFMIAAPLCLRLIIMPSGPWITVIFEIIIQGLLLIVIVRLNSAAISGWRIRRSPSFFFYVPSDEPKMFEIKISCCHF